MFQILLTPYIGECKRTPINLNQWIQRQQAHTNRHIEAVTTNQMDMDYMCMTWHICITCAVIAHKPMLIIFPKSPFLFILHILDMPTPQLAVEWSVHTLLLVTAMREQRSDAAVASPQCHADWSQHLEMGRIRCSNGQQRTGRRHEAVASEVATNCVVVGKS